MEDKIVLCKKQIGIIGISGRIGFLLTKLLEESEVFSLSGGVHSSSSQTDWEGLARNSDILVDFSRPAATTKAVEIAANRKIPIVIGTTGLSDKNLEKINRCAECVPIMRSSNFSLVTSLMGKLLQQCSKILTEFEFSILDLHHREKLDAPSGTALFLQEQAGRKAQIASIRSGNICGIHTCDFCGDDEMFTLSHTVFNRIVFAKGALECAAWLLNQKPSLYSMENYLRVKTACDI
jgi:4-hydroxy-tetrahydrodipicolinate reductase